MYNLGSGDTEKQNYMRHEAIKWEIFYFNTDLFLT